VYVYDLIIFIGLYINYTTLYISYSVAAVAEHTPCNRSLGVGICPLSYQCYELIKTCDGIIDCSDGYDEIACKCQAYFCIFGRLKFYSSCSVCSVSSIIVSLSWPIPSIYQLKSACHST